MARGMLRRGFFMSSAIWKMDVPPESEDESTAMPAPRVVSFVPEENMSASTN